MIENLGNFARVATRGTTPPAPPPGLESRDIDCLVFVVNGAPRIQSNSLVSSSGSCVGCCGGLASGRGPEELQVEVSLRGEAREEGEESERFEG